MGSLLLPGEDIQPAENQPLATKEQLADQLWRLNNLYWIIDEHGRRVRFQLNWAQEQMYHDMWYYNVILKARQLGFTTFIDIFGLDTALFNDNFAFSIVADTRDNANMIFETKIKYPYDNLPEYLKLVRPAKTERAGELAFANNSRVRVGTSLRSGTNQMLHVSEYGKISVAYPKKAREIKTGGFETVHQGCQIFVESTAEGRGGEFYDLCDRSRKLLDSKARLTLLDFKFHFFPWWKNPKYTMDWRDVPISSRMKEYFEALQKEHGIELSRGQKAWYTKKEETLGEDIFKEHPSTPDEAFEASMRGSYFGKKIREMRQEGKITKVPYVKGYPVETYWDIGVNDFNAIWFVQTIGREIRVIYYYEDDGLSFAEYGRKLSELAEKNGWRYGTHYGPHDLAVREIGSEDIESGGAKSRVQSARDHGINFEIVPRMEQYGDGVEAVRSILAHCVFDEEGCELGLSRLENHRKEWDAIRGVYKNIPFRGPDKHGADAFMTLARGHRLAKPPRRKGDKKPPPRGGWT